MNLKTIVITFCLFALVLNIFAQNYQTKKWQVTDLKFKFISKITEPLKVNFGAEFTCESGLIAKVPSLWTMIMNGL